MNRWIPTALVASAGFLLAVGIVLAFANPTISHTDDGNYQCFAPYDTVLLGDRDNVGDHPDSQDIEERCLAANRKRFTWACVFAGFGALGGGVAAAGVVRRRRRI